MTANAKVVEIIELQNLQDEIIEPTIYQTIDFSSVQNLCEKARRYKLMVGLLSDTGLGKTTSLRAYVSETSNAFMVTVDKTMNAKRLYVNVLSTLGVRFDGNIHDVMLKIAETLNGMESPVLIIDEAGKMNHVMMLYMHDLREYTRGKCGIVLAGMPYFKNNLMRFAHKQKEGCSEFLRRINLWHTLNGLTGAEIKYICESEGVDDPERVNELRRFRRFGDLMNEILLDKILKEEL